MDKIEYITNQFRKTFGKKYENYCITRIYNRLNNNDVKFVIQQPTKTKDNEIKFQDLYLPQVNMWIEIDEHYHSSDEQKQKDKIRTEEIINNNTINKELKRKYNALDEVIYSLEEPERIKVYGKSIEEINKKIEEIVEEINKRIKNLGDKFEPWNSVFIPPEEYIKKGYIKTSYNAKFRVIKDIAKMFGKDHPNVRSGFVNIKNEIYIWCPILKIEGFECEKNDWENEISDDGNIIYEIQKNKNNKYLNVLNENQTRYVFAKYKDGMGSIIYKFLGVYNLDKEKTKEENKRIWKKISDKIDLNEFYDNQQKQ